MLAIRTLVAFGLVLGLGTCVLAAEKGASKGGAQSKPNTVRKPIDKGSPVKDAPKGGSLAPQLAYILDPGMVKGAPKGGTQPKPSAIRKPADKSSPGNGASKPTGPSGFLVQLCGELLGKGASRAAGPSGWTWFSHDDIKGQGASKGMAPATIRPRIDKATPVKGAPKPAQNISESNNILDW